jgi:tryptophanase
MNDLSYRRDRAAKMFSLADGAVMSAKKDALVNMGGFLALRDERLAAACINLLIITEGFTTYGGLSGRDMEAIAIGLDEVFDPHYLDYRIRSTTWLGDSCTRLVFRSCAPSVATRCTSMPRSCTRTYRHGSIPGQALVCELYRLAGIRSVEIGSVMFGTYQPRTVNWYRPPWSWCAWRSRAAYTHRATWSTWRRPSRRSCAHARQVRGYRIVKEPNSSVISQHTSNHSVSKPAHTTA